jgi:hypothetical protein
MRRSAAISLCVLATVAFAQPAAGGSFRSSDTLLNRIWAASVKTVDDVTVPGPLTVDAEGRPCPIDLPVVLVDGVARDRCVDIGDLTVDFATLDASTPRWGVQRALIAWFADHQLANGAIPASPAGNELMDYSAYWVTALRDYTLYSGDLALVRTLWPHVKAVLDRRYASLRVRNLVVNPLGAADYAYIRRQGNVVAYYNAQYVLALREGAQLATWVGARSDAARWSAQARATTRAFNGSFWDDSLGVYHDTTVDTKTHPQDGNAFAVLASVASATQARRALDYLAAHNRYSWGNSIADTDDWDNPVWGYQASLRVYPFMSYFELEARFATGLDASAFDLLRREWGYMVDNGPGTMWESIGPYGGPLVHASLDHGWSSGAAPALTNDVLGVRPTSPGYATFTVSPHPGDLASAAGTVSTPHGTLRVAWRRTTNGRIVLTVEAPHGTRWTNAPRQAPPAG